MIKVYALSTCPWFKKTKSLLTETNMDYDVIDVDLLEDDEQEIALTEVEKLSGAKSFPVIVIGEKIIAGYNPDAILEAIKNEK